MRLKHFKTTIIILAFFTLLSLTACSKTDNKFSAKETNITNKIPVDNHEFSPPINCITNKTEKEVRGNSMEPLISAGETLVLLENYYKCNKVKRGETKKLRLKKNQIIFKPARKRLNCSGIFGEEIFES